MDIRAQEKTFSGFYPGGDLVCIISAAVLIFMCSQQLIPRTEVMTMKRRAFLALALPATVWRPAAPITSGPATDRAAPGDLASRTNRPRSRC